MGIKKLSCLFLVLAFGVISACDILGGGTNYSGANSGTVEDGSSTTYIKTFSAAGVSGKITTGRNITVTVPFCTNITSLTPTITHTGVSLSPASGVAQDFTDPVVYTVTASDGSTKDYTVTVTKPAYILRDVGPAGGLIFYDQGNCLTGGWRYLEAAPSDQSTSQVFSDVANTLVNNIGCAIGTGQANTANIIAQAGHTTSAAKLCDDLVVGGYSDWFLPSKDELALMYTELKLYNVGGFTSHYYWSSSELNSYDAWVQGFFGVTQNLHNKNYTNSVRCVRAF